MTQQLISKKKCANGAFLVFVLLIMGRDENT